MPSLIFARITRWRYRLALGLLILSACDSGALSPQESLKQMKVADGFEVSLVASEPEIRQPLSSTFDERGRLWVIQYLQYPTPAGLKPVSVDNYLRTKYDRVPEPPPRGPKGADRITICELSPDGTRALNFKDFVTGLNLCSGLALGHGGAFVLQPPYLLFYADKNHDDVPDGDPEVLLTGFGMEDAHAVANSLTWGPDGWLYGAQGSTVTAHIRNLEFQQGIWRYHPVTKEFELFAEGGGNTWGLDFDPRGEVLAGTNFEDKMLHQVQGAYYIKNFGKHGALHNPYTYGYFEHVPYSGYRARHISAGGIAYQGGAFPAAFEGVYIFADVLDHAVYWARMQPDGSSFTATFGGALLKTDDELFRPVDCEAGPDGAVYICDWCDKRASHVDPLDTWDRSNGRIYRVQSRTANLSKPKLPNERTRVGERPSSGAAMSAKQVASESLQPPGESEPAAPGDGRSPVAVPKGAGFDLRKLSSDQLVDLLDQPNAWFSRKARLLLAERRDAKVLPRLRNQIADKQNPRLALQSLWALYVSGGFAEELAGKLLRHPNENVRAWTIRFLGDARHVSPASRSQLVTLARSETSPVVRSQLACSAKRLPAEDALPIIAGLLRHDDDVNDQHIPMLLWWALEDKATASRTQVLQLFSSPDLWRYLMTQKFILERLARRYAEEGGDAGLGACARLLSLAPNPEVAQTLLKGMDLALVGGKLENAPAALKDWFAKAWPNNSADVTHIRLGLRLGYTPAREAAVGLLKSEASREATAESLIEVLGQTETVKSAPLFLELFGKSKSEKVREVALAALQHFPEPQIAESLLQLYPRLNKRLQDRELKALCSRAQWARLLVGSVEAGRIAPGDLTLDHLRQLAALQDADLQQQVEKRWGRIQTSSPDEKRSTINRLKLVLIPSGVVGRNPKGNFAEGKKVFQANCAICHKLFGEGNSIGPDLTGADRKNTDYLLAQIVEPSAYIRPEYVAYQAQLKDESVIDGLMVESTSSAVTLMDRNNERHILPRAQIRELKESQVSLMPEGLLEGLSPESVMNLFAYLQAKAPPAANAPRASQ
jgi:putative membrane-bound dehydrogenase-like protein